MNTSGVTPIEYNVVFLPDDVTEKTKGGLYIPDEARARDQHAATRGVIVAVAPLAYTRTASGDEWAGPKPAPGDRVMIGKYAGKHFEGADGKTYRVLKDEDVIGLIESE